MKLKKIIANIITVMSVAGLIFGCKGVAVKASELNKSEKTITELKTDTKVETLKSKNEDYRFWLNIEGTQVDYPVVQSADNSFYLSKDFNKEDNVAGTPFLDYRNNSIYDKNTIVYAHHMKNGSMFGELKKFKDEKFFQENGTVTVNVDNETRIYEVFSVYVTSAKTDYLKIQFSEGEYAEYLNQAIKSSIHRKNIEVNEGDNIITFSTCSYEFNNARLVVHAKLIK